MSIAKFIQDPLGYTKGHIVQFSHQAQHTSPAASGMTCTGTMNHWSGDWTAEEYAMAAGQFTSFEFQEGFNDQTQTRSRIGKGASKMHTVVCKTSGADLGVRFLPWKANCVTYMALDAAATRFFTGPLSGCCIYMGATSAGTPYVFHANRNNSGGVGNSAVKSSMTTAVVTRMGTVVKIDKFAIYKQHYNDFGFVFGVKTGNQWKYHVADTGFGKKGGTFITKVVTL